MSSSGDGSPEGLVGQVVVIVLLVAVAAALPALLYLRARQQKEMEQQVEMEKFIELEYSREDEQPTPWAFEELKTARGPPLGDAAAGASTAARAAPFFYGGSQFKLYRQQPVQLPTRQTARGEVEDLKVSTNFFNRAWSGERRLRNLIITLEWSPRAPSAHEGALPIAPDMQPRLDACLDRIWKRP